MIDTTRGVAEQTGMVLTCAYAARTFPGVALDVGTALILPAAGMGVYAATWNAGRPRIPMGWIYFFTCVVAGCLLWLGWEHEAIIHVARIDGVFREIPTPETYVSRLQSGLYAVGVGGLMGGLISWGFDRMLRGLHDVVERERKTQQARQNRTDLIRRPVGPFGMEIPDDSAVRNPETTME